MNIMVDVDGCLYPFVDAIRSYLEEEGLSLPIIDAAEYHLPTSLGFTQEVFDQHYRDAVTNKDLYLSQYPYEGAAEAVRAMKNKGHRIIIVTARDLTGIVDICEAQTSKWLVDHNIPFDELHLSSDKRVVKVDIAIDDTISHLTALQETYGTKGIVFSRPYNQGVKWPYRVDNWEEIPELVDKLANI